MDLDDKINPNPEIFAAVRIEREEDDAPDDDDAPEPFDVQEIFDLIRDISDPEHPHSLEELKVMQPDGVVIDNEAGLVSIRFTPTIPHCSMSTLIG
jgi:metal-sulfur cluster biosynthetic enzyme